MGNCNSSTFTK